MNQIKLGVSVGFLSVLGYFFAYYQLWICVALLLFLLAINAETIAKQNVMQGAILSIGFSIPTLSSTVETSCLTFVLLSPIDIN